ncbi:MAG TPA: site-specific integrase [Polyangiales bacterium]|nr:site-specific integrase [Polyangiales bacterium]
MIELFFRDPHVLARLRRQTPLGDGLDELAAHLHRRGHAVVTVRDYLRGAAHFGHWMSVKRIPLGDLCEEVVERFVDRHLPRCRCTVPKGLPLTQLHAGLGHLLEVMRTLERIPAARPSHKVAADLLVDEYREYLRDVHGAAQRTIDTYTGHVSEFLAAGFGKHPINLWSLSARDVIDFVESYAVHWRPKTTKLLATTLRSFFRYMQARGLCDERLVSAVPTIPEWKLARVPKILGEEQIRALLDAFQRQTDVGQRDYAIAVCLCHLALRANEVAELCIDHFDWRSGAVSIVGKSRRASRLPLPATVGRAVARYLRSGRPKTSARQVFVRHCVPRGARMSAAGIRAIIRRAFDRTDVQVPSKGTHALRHTAATRMVRAGASLKEVADVLRHRSLDTTAIYTKVDLPRLAEVAMPWPEAKS